MGTQPGDGSGAPTRDGAALDRDPDDVLFRRFREGDGDAFEVLLRRHRRTVHAFIARYLADRQLADDIYQEVFLRVVSRADEFRGASQFTTWLYSIARNLCIDAARRAVHRNHASLDEMDRAGRGPMVERIAGSSLAADRQAIGGELRQLVQAALEDLPVDQREVFLLRETEHLTFGEIAVVVGAPEATVKSRMRYALERLQGALAEYEDYARALR